MPRRLVDLSHEVEAGLVTYPGLPAPVVSDFLSREASRARFAEGTTFHIARIELVANTGTYVDSPFHRYAEGADLAALPLERLADLEGLVIDATGRGRAIDADAFDGLAVEGKAVLVRTGWDRHWQTPRYFDGHPFLTARSAERLAPPPAGAGGHRLAEHRRHRGRQPAGPFATARRRHPDRRAPVQPGEPARERIPRPLRPGQVPRRGDLPRAGVRRRGVSAPAGPRCAS